MINVATNRTVTNVIDNEYHEYAMYVLQNRAIPSAIDGFKPVHRKLLYAMLTEHKGKKTKCSDLGGISKFGYHHGESSAIGAAIGLTAEYNNNVTLFKGHGNYGSRLIQEAAAPRYIFAELNSKFYDYFADFEVCDVNSNPENPEPQTYLPYIPWVLVNGVEGIAVGFACKFMPHAPKDLANACIDYLKGKKIKPLIPTFPNFSGEVIDNGDGKYSIRGKITRTKRNTWEITEVPYGYDRETVYNILTKMEDENKLYDFVDECDKTGFKFTIKLDGTCDAKCMENPISYFKLEKNVAENYTTLNEFGKLKIFDNKSDIVKYFVDYRLGKVSEKIQYDIDKISKEITKLKLKVRFISDNISKKIQLNTRKKAEWVTGLSTAYKTTPEMVEWLLGTSMVDMTEDYIDNLNLKITERETELTRLKTLDAKELYIEKLTKISKLS